MTKGQDTQSKIVRAATDQFYSNGIQWVSFQQIATEVGISQAALYKYFSDKDDLLKACAIAAASNGREIIDQGLDEKKSAKHQLSAYIEGNFNWVLSRPKEATMVLSLYYFALTSKALKEVLDAIHTESIRRLSVRLEMGNREGLWKVRNSLETARAIHDLLLGEMIKSVHSPKELTKKARIEFVQNLVESIISSH